MRLASSQSMEQIAIAMVSKDACPLIEASMLTLPDLLDSLPMVEFIDFMSKSTSAYGRVTCLSPQNGHFNITDIDWNAIPKAADGYSWVARSPLTGAKVATGTTSDCEKWYKAAVGDTCTAICLAQKITSSLFLSANPALGNSMDSCDATLKSDLTYCTGPTYSFKGG